jgi:hypothetical protein
MDAKKGAALSLETVDSKRSAESQPIGCPEGVAKRRQQTGDAAASPHQAGNRSRRGAPRQPQPQRVLAHESE